ncbi:MAG: VanZ family protein [bacterium]
MKCRSCIISFSYYWLPPILYCIFIFALSSLSSVSIGPSLPNIDKLYHSILYFILTLLFFRALDHTLHPIYKGYALWIAPLLTILYGCSDELHQFFVPLRKADIWDLLFDAVGACIALLSIIYLKKVFKRSIDAEC